MGIKLDQISPSKPRERSRSLTDFLQQDINWLTPGFGSKKKETFYTSLSVLLKAGIPLKDALGMMVEGVAKKKDKAFYTDLLTALVSGKSFSEVIRAQEVFTEYEYQSIHIGEEAGTLPEVIDELAAFFQRKNEQRRNLVNVLTYPVIILATAFLVILFMLRMVVPMFQDIFRQNQVELPWITRVVVRISGLLESYGLWILLALLLALIGRRWITKNANYRRWRDRMLLKLPYMGRLIKSVYMAQFTRAIGLLTRSKVPVLNSIHLAGKMIEFTPLKEALDRVSDRILRGADLSEALSEHPIFDKKMIALVKVAEETNQTAYIFERLHEQYSIEVQQRSKLLSTLLEPLIILIVGVVVGLILIAMYLPMFKLGSVLGG